MLLSPVDYHHHTPCIPGCSASSLHPCIPWPYPASCLALSASAFPPSSLPPLAYLSLFLPSPWQTPGLSCVPCNHRRAHTPPPAAEMPQTWKRARVQGGQRRNGTCTYTEPMDDGSKCAHWDWESTSFRTGSCAAFPVLSASASGK